MLYFILWVLLSMFVVFLLILEDKNSRKVPNWLNWTTFIVFFWFLIPWYTYDRAIYPLYVKYNDMRNRQEEKRK